ncbi:MAG: S41 family peptidase [Flavobacteriales bacterium]|nr:S41 family peptidase [Flavobacteriales bacterium]
MKKLLLRNKALTAIILLVCMGASSLAFKDNFFEISKNLELFTLVYKELDTYYVDETQPGQLMKTGIDAMMKSLDPYTVYYPESKIEDVRFQRTGQYGGIGVAVKTIDGKITVTDIYEGSKAIEAGLKLGDVVVALDGNRVVGKDHTEIEDLVKGPNGTILEMLVTRGDESQTELVSIERTEIQIPDITYQTMVDDKTGYIALRSFTKTASKSVQSSYRDLKDQGMQRVILDLRGNGGGLLREAVNLVNLFVPKNQLVVSTKGKIDEWNKSYSTLNDPLSTDIPVIVLVNGSSASASEIVSGTLQDLDRAVVVGTQSFGKGLVQQTKDLQYNAKMKLTVAKYLTPSGRCVQKLNYSERNADGSVEEVPDSLIKPFSTVNGRPVFDGRGIDPDVRVEKPTISYLEEALVKSNVIFKYAVEYSRQNNEIAEPESFSLTEEEYKAFTQFVIQDDFELETKSSKKLDALQEMLSDEKLQDVVSTEYTALLEKVKPNKQRDMMTFKMSIKKQLEEAIVKQFYGNEGVSRYKMTSDEDVKQALMTFDSNYNSILGN